MSRHPSDVIGDILEILPEDRTSLDRKLRSIKDSSSYCASENMEQIWEKIYLSLASEFGDLENELTDNIKKIVQGEQ